MNKYQEALDGLKFSIDFYHKQSNKIINCENTKFKILQELIDKEEPKKPLKDYSIGAQYLTVKFQYVCPNCNKPLGLHYDEMPNDYDQRCGHCGQVIDWSEVEGC